MSTANGTTAPQPNWTARHTAGGILSVLGLAAVALAPAPVLVSWLLFLLLMGAFTAIAADGINGRKLAILIDERNKISLARLQMASWTLLILSAFLAAAIGNVRTNAPMPLNIVIPEAVWLLMGISTTSLVGTPLILSTKCSTTAAPGPTADGNAAPPNPNTAEAAALTGGTATAPAPTAPAASPKLPGHRPLASIAPRLADVLRAQGEDPSRLHVNGSLILRQSIDDAAWSDVFKGDELGDVATLDLSKIQMFFFTVVLLLTYAIALGTKFSAADAARAELGTGPWVETRVGRLDAAAPDPRLVDSFPPLQSGFVTLLGISNAGFLVNKAVPRPQPPT